jgi:putative glutamine amidotransferase
MRQPLIGISGSIRRYDGADRAGVNASYVHSIARSGGIPVILTPAIRPEGAFRAIEACDGLVLTGGHDVDPEWYDASPSPALGQIDRPRDEFELALFHAARARHLPILGICRGLQVINIAMGGTLWQDLPSERPGQISHDDRGARRDARTHGIALTEGSRLAAALGTASLVTNSFHHQAVRDLAQGLEVAALADDGVIEGVEGEGSRGWLLAVQWHPEEFHRELNAPDQKLFDALVEACRRERS